MLYRSEQIEKKLFKEIGFYANSGLLDDSMVTGKRPKQLFELLKEGEYERSKLIEQMDIKKVYFPVIKKRLLDQVQPRMESFPSPEGVVDKIAFARKGGVAYNYNDIEI